MGRAFRIVAACVVAAVAVAGCSATKTRQSSTQNGVLTVIANGTSPTFVDNYNLASPNLVPLANMMYEPLVYLDDNHMSVRPYLARSWDWSADAKTLTMHLRQNVTWSDGQPFTSADVKYTFLTLPKKYPKLPFPAPQFQTLKTPDSHTVVFNFAAPARSSFGPYSWTGSFIVPEHVWSKHNLSTWTNPNPVTTGPFTVDKFSPQQITLKVRNDWWGGKSAGVRYVKVLPSASPEATETIMLKGKADWANQQWTGATQQWINPDPAHHKYWVTPNAFHEITFNMGKAPFKTSLPLRKALTEALDPTKLAKVLDVGSGVPNVTSMSPQVFGDQVAPEFRKQSLKPNAAKAKSDLAASGYTVVGGTLRKNGKPYPLTLTGEQADAPMVRTVVAQWKQVLGLSVTPKLLSTNSYSDALANGDFDMIRWQGGGCGVACNFSYLNSSGSAPLGKAAAADMSRTSDATTDRLLNKLSVATTAKQIQQLGWQVQRRFVAQQFYIPLDSIGATAVINTTRWNFPAKFQGNAFPGLGLNSEPAIVIMHLTPTGH